VDQRGHLTENLRFRRPLTPQQRPPVVAQTPQLVNVVSDVCPETTGSPPETPYTTFDHYSSRTEVNLIS